MQLHFYAHLLTIAGIAYARPQTTGGYTYERNYPGTNNIFSRNNNNNNENIFSGTILPPNHKISDIVSSSNTTSTLFNLGTPFKSNNNILKNGFNPGSIFNNLNSNSPSKGGDKYLPPATTTPEPIITKQFFLVSAPEESEESRTRHFVIGRPQKNYRVVFIKAPSTDTANVRLTAEYAPQEEKTVIYVLSKKSNDVDIGEIATPAPTKPTKPEIFFIKYRTNEEASAAQKDIQEQYDQLGGTNEFVDQGILPVKSVIGSLDGIAEDGGYDYKRIRNSQSSGFN